MHLLILGYSSIVRRRVLPAARALGVFPRISIASRSQRGSDDGAAWYGDYDEALASSGADAVYVSGVNTAHLSWTMRALERGLHVMVDKPAFADPATTRQVAALARARGRALAEATVYTFHPQVAAIRDLLADADRSTMRVTAVFSVPPLPAADFRYRADCGGGCLSDLGPYAVSINRVLIGAAPSSVSCRVLTRSSEVDTSFSALMTHESGASIAAHCGFVTAYQNRLSVLTADRAVDVDRIFTIPPDVSNTIRIREASGDRAVTAPAGDAFAEFLRAFAAAVARGDTGAFESAMVEDAELLERLRRAAVH